MVEEEVKPGMEGRRRGEVRRTEKSIMQGCHFKMSSSQYPDEKCSPAPLRSSSSDFDARPVSINDPDSTFFPEKEPNEIQERKSRRANLRVQSASDGRVMKKRAASRKSSALGQEKAVRPRNMKTSQRGAKEKGAARKIWMTWLSAVVGVVILIELPGTSEAAILKPTRQSLPPDCKWLLKEHHDDCPDRADSIYAPLWNKLNTLCCYNYPGKFHCQFKIEGGTTYSVPACLQNQTVPIGKRGSLIINGSGYPELDLHSDCPSDTFRDHAVDSTFILHWYCDSTKAQEEAGEEKWCDGGPSADDLFICRKGYYAENCPHGRNNSHDACPCEPMQLHNGSLSFRNVTGTCDSGINVTYGYTFPVSTLGMSTSTPSYQLNSSASGDGEINSTTPTWITKPGSNVNDHDYGFLGPVLGVLVALVAFFGLLGFFCYWKHTRNSDLPE